MGAVKINQQALKKVLKGAARQFAANAQEVLDDVRRTHSGKPVPEVLRRLRTATRKAGWTASDEELRPYAEVISNGGPVEARP